MNCRTTPVIVVLLIALACLSARAAGNDSHNALAKGTAWLLSQQASDGGWHSATYGQMSSGVGNTALVVWALTQMSPEERSRHEPEIERGVEFLISNLEDEGYVSAPSHSADYPIYATSLLCRTLDKLQIDRWHNERRRMRGYLLSVQRAGAAKDPLQGGWPQGGGDPRDSHLEINVNVSVSRHAMEALQAEWNDNQAARQAALEFLARCQNRDDGGFCFIPRDEDPLNKAGVSAAGKARSYGTATADGLLALLACGLPRDDLRVRTALAWLESHDSLDAVPGISDEDTAIKGAREALRFYYCAAIANVIAALPDSTLAKRRDQLIAILVNEQHSDGSWSNPSTLMREDDPLIATALAVSAIATLQGSAAH